MIKWQKHIFEINYTTASAYNTVNLITVSYVVDPLQNNQNVFEWPSGTCRALVPASADCKLVLNLDSSFPMILLSLSPQCTASSCSVSEA